MKKNLTDITVIIDRSGSMQKCREEAENGLNHFIKEQQKAEGKTDFTLVQFDTEYEFLYNASDVKEVEPYKLVPRGMTALLDAVGRAVNETGARLDAIPKRSRPGLVQVIIVTDGQENSSQEFKLQQIKEMIETRKSTDEWKFTFLGANQDAFAEAAGMGIGRGETMTYDPSKTAEVFTAMAGNTQRMRVATRTGVKVMNTYTDRERSSVSK